MRTLAFSAALALVVSVPALAQEYRPAYEEHTGALGRGSEIVLVYFGMTDCVPCHDPEFKAALEQAKVALAERAATEGRSFAAVGVALDWNVAEGFSFLQESGAFDELVIGRNWENSAALAHLWRPEGLDDRPIAIPSIMVFERTISAEGPITASAPVYLFEATGAPAVSAWVAAGVPFE